ncbi:hypothetical protein Taro_044710 [Colocasia esculenta]|uniref:Uncharacterized protein n=1 Tax=Colocasia esculenta TaxID=4460 RepID=A0A843WPD8_COLES|nr:hypothetical protein [Colocasia esculenta]
MQTDLEKAEDWASRETVSCVDLSTGDLVLSTGRTCLSTDGIIPVDRCTQTERMEFERTQTEISTFDHHWVEKKEVVPFGISWHDVELEISLKHSGLLEEMIRPINTILSEIKRQSIKSSQIRIRFKRLPKHNR